MVDAPYLPQAVLDAATEAAWLSGLRVLQGCRLAEDDASHVAVLLNFMAPVQGAVILDIGCGFGEVARLMREQRPDLDFVLLNKNALQLSHAPVDLPRVRGDMHRLPLGTATVDGALFCYSLCHADIPCALYEAARVTRPGGTLLVYDYVRHRGDNDLFESRLAARALPSFALRYVATAAGWLLEASRPVTGDDTPFRQLYANDEEYDAIFDDLTLILWRLRRVD